MSYRYGGCLYETRARRDLAMAEDWLRANGLNSFKEVAESFQFNTDEELADEVMKEWDVEDSNRQSVIDAFAELRERRLQDW